MLALFYSFFSRCTQFHWLLSRRTHRAPLTHYLLSLFLSRPRAPTNLVSSLQTFFVAEYSPLQSATAGVRYAASSSPSAIFTCRRQIFHVRRGWEMKMRKKERKGRNKINNIILNISINDAPLFRLKWFARFLERGVTFCWWDASHWSGSTAFVHVFGCYTVTSPGTNTHAFY